MPSDFTKWTFLFCRISLGFFAVAALAASLLLSSCDGIDLEGNKKDSQITYSRCLQLALQGGHALSAVDIRSLCDEIAGTADPRYKFDGGNLVPTNDFTRCYKKVEATLSGKGVSDSQRLARLSCRYSDVE